MTVNERLRRRDQITLIEGDHRHVWLADELDEVEDSMASLVKEVRKVRQALTGILISVILLLVGLLANLVFGSGGF